MKRLVLFLMAIVFALASPVPKAGPGGFSFGIERAEAGLAKGYLKGRVAAYGMKKIGKAVYKRPIRKVVRKKAYQVVEKRVAGSAFSKGIRNKYLINVERRFAERLNMSPYAARRAEALVGRVYSPRTIRSKTLPPLNGQNVRLANRGRSIDDGIVPFNERGYPIFDKHAKFDTRLRDYDPAGRRESHFEQATRDLRKHLELIGRNDDTISHPLPFNAQQLKAIRSGKARVPGYVWHHHEDFGRLQLIPRTIHERVGHHGGFSLRR